MNPFEILPILVLIAAVLLVILWFTVVKASTIRVSYWFGEFYRVLRPGPHLVKWPVETSEVISTATRQIELPADEKNIDRTSENPPLGKAKPIRVTHSGFREAIFYVKKGWTLESGEYPFNPDATSLDELDVVIFKQLPPDLQKAIETDSVNAPLQGEFSIVVEWDLKSHDEKAVEEYISSVSTTEGRTRDQEIQKRMADQADSVLQTYLRPVSHGHARLMKRLFDGLIQHELEVLVGEKPNPRPGAIDKTWGIHIGTAYIKNPYAGHTVADAQADAAASVSRAQNTIRDSEAQAQKIRNEAAAARDAEIDKGKGEAGRIEVMAKVMSDPNAIRIAELDVQERGYEAYQRNTTVTTYAPGATAFVPLGK